MGRDDEDLYRAEAGQEARGQQPGGRATRGPDLHSGVAPSTPISEDMPRVPPADQGH